MTFPIGYQFSFQAVKGVGNVEINLTPNRQIYTFIGENGVGKTKLLESLFIVLLLTNEQVQSKKSNNYIFCDCINFQKFNKHDVIDRQRDTFMIYENPFNLTHHIPPVYLSAQNRGAIQQAPTQINQLGDKKSRLDSYLDNILTCFQNNPDRLKSLNMNTSIEEWIIQRAQSANRFQADEDNREIEITTLLNLLNQIDNRINPEFLEISGSNRVFIKIEGQKLELAKLSSGFTSILKIIQAIVSGYSFFTNEKSIVNVRGIVLIDEIESHLHNQWQVKILPLLKQLFPNTTFFISTHSSLVISQLEQGEAYRLQRDSDRVVRSHLIEYPNNVSFIDLLDTAFNVNLNQLKIQHDDANNQSEQKAHAKKVLLSLIQDELTSLGGA